MTGWEHSRFTCKKRPVLHEARHTFASALIAAGVDAKAITTYMGHASIQTT
jgi:site-specific recombinase XerD